MVLVGATVRKKWNKVKNKIMKKDETPIDGNVPKWETIVDRKELKIYSLNIHVG